MTENGSITVLPDYKIRARNTSAASENKIHDDKVAASFGFKGGLVPGVTVYGYMTVPLVTAFSYDWLERGTMRVKFHQPAYEGDELLICAEVNAEVNNDSEPIKVTIRAERDGTVCATGVATINDRAERLAGPDPRDYPESTLPLADRRPPASPENLRPGTLLGTIVEKLDLRETESGLLRRLAEPLEMYRGNNAVAHPTALLTFANYALMYNFQLGPWIHAASDLINWSVARDGELISVRGRITECFEKKGHEFVVLDLLLLADSVRPVQQVRHTAIYRMRK